MIEVQILIPTTDNDEVEFPSSHYVTWEKRLTKLFPRGWNLSPGTVTGEWSDAGRVYRDKLLVYTVGLSGIVAHAASILKAVRFARDHFRQEAIYVRYLNVSEVL